MGVYRYNPLDGATSRSPIMSISGGANLGAVLGDTPDSPGTSESTYATTSPTNAIGAGFAPQYTAPALTPAAAGIPAGHAITAVQAFCRIYEATSAGYPGAGGFYSSNPTWSLGVKDGSGYGADVVAGGALPLNSVTWVQTPLTNMYVPNDKVATYLQYAGLYASNNEGSGLYGAIDCDTYIYGLYVKFTTRIELEANIPFAITGPGEASEQHIGGTFPVVNL